MRNRIVSIVLCLSLFTGLAVSPACTRQAHAFAPAVPAAAYAAAAVLGATGVLITAEAAQSMRISAPGFGSYIDSLISAGASSVNLSDLAPYVPQIITGLLGCGLLSLPSVPSTAQQFASGYHALGGSPVAVACVDDSFGYGGFSYVYQFTDSGGNSFFLRDFADSYAVSTATGFILFYDTADFGIWVSPDGQVSYSDTDTLEVSSAGLGVVSNGLYQELTSESVVDYSSVAVAGFVAGTPSVLAESVAALDVSGVSDFVGSSDAVIDLSNAESLSTSTTYGDVVTGGGTVLDWIWGILQRILDAILSIPGAIANAWARIVAAIQDLFDSLAGLAELVRQLAFGFDGWTFDGSLGNLRTFFGSLFPFCLVLDIADLAGSAGSSVESFSWSLSLPLAGFGLGLDDMVFDLSMVRQLGNYVRGGLNLLFCAGLLALTRQIFLDGE